MELDRPTVTLYGVVSFVSRHETLRTSRTSVPEGSPLFASRRSGPDQDFQTLRVRTSSANPHDSGETEEKRRTHWQSEVFFSGCIEATCHLG